MDVSTGRVFTIPKTDLFLPGLFNLSLIRSYSSDRRDIDAGIGFGWTHSLAWTLEERRASVIVRTGDGQRVELPRPAAPGDEARLGPWGVFRDEEGYAVRPGNEFVHFFRPVEPGSKVHVLHSIAYRRRGRISLFYERGRLARAIDTVGRVVVFHGRADGRIESVSVPDPHGRALVFARYAYDSEGNLVAAADADGHTTRFAYDDDHRLTRLEYPNGLTFHFIYNQDGRCIETWGAYPDGRDPALAGGLPDVLRNGRTRARGIYHCRFEYDGDYTEVVDSVRLQRFFVGPEGTIEKAVDARGGVTSRTFDRLGRVTSQTDPTEATWLYQYDELDEIVAETSPEGHQTILAHPWLLAPGRAGVHGSVSLLGREQACRRAQDLHAGEEQVAGSEQATGSRGGGPLRPTGMWNRGAGAAGGGDHRSMHHGMRSRGAGAAGGGAHRSTRHRASSIDAG